MPALLKKGQAVKNMKIAIIGYGEIGSSLAKVYQEKKMVPMIRDLDVNTIRETLMF